MFELSEKNLLHIIRKVKLELRQGENMEKVRGYFPSGEKDGDKFVSLLYKLQEQELIKNVQFIFDGNDNVDDANWSNVMIAAKGLRILEIMG